MPRQANGNYLAPANTAAVSGATISSTAFNTLETDIGTEITNSVDRGGRSAMTAALPMGGQKITGMADPAVPTDGATKNYVDTVTAAFFSTGDMKPTLKTVADTGWVMFDDGTIGSAGSGSSSRANADTQSLFTLLFNNVLDANCQIFTSGGAGTTRAAQTNAATAWAANCRMSLPRVLGRAMGGAGSGLGLTTRALAAPAGQETVTLTAGQLPANIPYTDPTHVHNEDAANVKLGSGSSVIGSGGTATGVGGTTQAAGVGITINPGGGGAHTIVQPIVFINWMVKL